MCYHNPKIAESENCKPELQILLSVWWLPQDVTSEAIKFLPTYLDGDKFSTNIMTQQPPKSCYLLKLLDMLFPHNKGQVKVILFFSNLHIF